MIRKLFAEALATAILLATIVGSGIMAERLAGGNQALALLGNTLPTGAILVVLITVFGPVSGAHMNPLASVALACRQRLPWTAVVPYAASQLAGALIGVIATHAMFELPLLQVPTNARTGYGQWLGEAVATAGLILTIVGCLEGNRRSVASAVGLYITAAYWFTSSTSFANPTVTIARAVSDTFTGIAPANAPAFIAAQAAGTVLALAASRLLWGSGTDQLSRP